MTTFYFFVFNNLRLIYNRKLKTVIIVKAGSIECEAKDEKKTNITSLLHQLGLNINYEPTHQMDFEPVP